MGIEVPPWAAEMFHVVTGDAWPEADEDEIYALAQLWFSIGRELQGFAPEVTRAAKYLSDSGALAGDAQKALEAAVAVVTGDGDLTLEKLAVGFEELGEYLRQVALQTQYMKIIVLEQLVILAAQILYLIAMMPWTFGASAAGIAALQIAGRQFALAVMRQLAIAIVTGEVLQVGLDAIAQFAQMAEGWRHGFGDWDTNLTKSAAITGAIGGALGPVLQGLGHYPAKLLGKTLSGMLGRHAGREAGDWAAEALKGAVHEYLTDGVSGAVQGQGWRPDTFSAVAGAVDEGVTGAGSLGRRKGGHRFYADALGKAFGFTPPQLPGKLGDGSGTDELVVPTRTPNEYVATTHSPGEHVPDVDQVLRGKELVLVEENQLGGDVGADPVGQLESVPSVSALAARVVAEGLVRELPAGPVRDTVRSRLTDLLVAGRPEAGSETLTPQRQRAAEDWALLLDPGLTVKAGGSVVQLSGSLSDLAPAKGSEAARSGEVARYDARIRLSVSVDGEAQPIDAVLPQQVRILLPPDAGIVPVQETPQPEVFPELHVVPPPSGSGVLSGEQAAEFWGITADVQVDAALRPGLTGRVPVAEVVDAGSWGLGHIVAIRPDTVAEGSVLARGDPVADPLGLRPVLERVLTPVGAPAGQSPGAAVDHVLGEFRRLLPHWSSADVLNTLDAHRLWRGVDVAVPAAGRDQIISVRLRPWEGAAGLAASAVEIPDHVAAGVADELWLDSYQRNDVTRTGSTGFAATGTASAGWDLLAGTPWTAGLTGRLFGGGDVGTDTSVRTYTTRTSVVTARGVGQWAAYDVPAVLEVTAAARPAGPGGTPDAAEPAQLPVRVRLRLPVELTREPGVDLARVQVPVTDPAARTDLLAAAALSAESASTGDLYPRLRELVAAELGPPGSDHPLGEARWAVDNLVHEPHLLRHLPDLGAGVHSPRFALAPVEGGELVAVGDAPVFRHERASQLGQDRWLVRGTPFGRLRVTAEVTAVEILDSIPDDIVGVVAKRHQGLVEQTSVSASSTLGAGVRGGAGYADGVGGMMGADAFGSLGATAGAGSALSARAYPKARLLPEVPTRRVRLDVQWTADLLRSDHQGLGVGESGASRRWPLTAAGQITARLPEADVDRLLQRTGAWPEPAGDGTEEILPDRRKVHDRREEGFAPPPLPPPPSPPPPLLAGTGLGGGLVDELSGASRAVPQLEAAAREAARDALRELGLAENAVPGAFWLQLRQGLESVLSPAALRVSQQALVQGGVQLPPVVQRLPRAAGAQAIGEMPHELRLSARVRAEIVPGTARHVGGLASALVAHGGEQWQVSVATRRTARAATGGGSLTLTLGGLTGSAEVSFLPSLTAGGSVGFTRAVAATSGTWVGTDTVISRTGPTDAFDVDVRFVAELDLRVTPGRSAALDEAASGSRWLARERPDRPGQQVAVWSPPIETWPGRLRVQVPAGLTGAGPGAPVPRVQAALALPSPVPAVPQGWSPIRFSVLERVLEMRTGPLLDVVASVLDRAGAGQRGLTGKETARELHVWLDPESLRSLLRPMISAGGYTVALRAPGGQRVLGVLRMAPELMTAPQGRQFVTGPDGVVLNVADEGQLWVQNESATTLGVPATARVSLGAPVGGELESGQDPATASQGWQVTGIQGTDRQLSFEAFTLDLAGERITWGERPVDVESRGVRWVVRYEPTSFGSAWTRRVAETFLVEDGASVIVPRGDHPLRRLAERRASDVPSGPATSKPEPSIGSGGAADLVTRGNALFLGPSTLGDDRVAELGEPVLDHVVDLLQAHGRRFLAPRPVRHALAADVRDEPSGAGRGYPELPPVLRDSLSLDSLPGLLSAAMSGGVAVPIPPVRGGGRIRFGYVHLQATVRGEPRLVDRLSTDDARLQRHHLRIETRSATLGVSATTTATAGPSTFSVTVPSPVGLLSVSRTAYRQTGAGMGMTRTAGPSVEVWTSAAVVAPHVVYEAEVALELRLLRDVTAGQWSAVTGAPLRAARWVAGQLMRAGKPELPMGWRRAGGADDVLTPAGRRTTSTTVRVAVPEPLSRHQPAPPRVSRVIPQDVDDLLAQRALRPSARALGQAGLVPYSVDPSAAGGVVREVIATLIEAGGPLAGALSGGSHLARSLEYALSNAELGTRLNEFLAGDTYEMSLDSVGGLITDTGTHLRLGATLVGVTPLTWATVARTRSPSAIRGSMDAISTSGSRSAVLGHSVGGVVAGGVAVTGSHLTTGTGTEADRWAGLTEGVDTEAFSQTGPMLLVSADLLVSVAVATRAESALTVRSGPTAPRNAESPSVNRAEVLADGAAVLAIDWAEARRLGLRHPDGEATQSGWHLPPEQPPSQGAEPGGAEERLAAAAQTLPAFRDWRTVSGQVTTDGRMLLGGRALEPKEVLNLLGRHEYAVPQLGLIVVASGGLAVGRRLAAISGRPVVATAGVVASGPDGSIVADDGGWQLVGPDGRQIRLDANLIRALTTEAAVAAAAVHRPQDATNSDAILMGTGRRGSGSQVTWPAPVAARTLRRRVGFWWDGATSAAPPALTVGRGSERAGVLSESAAAQFWGLGGPVDATAALRPALTGRVPVAEVVDADSWGLARILAVRPDTTAAESAVPQGGATVPAGVVDPITDRVADPLELRPVLAQALTDLGSPEAGSGQLIDRVLVEVRRMLPHWSSADALNTLDAHRLWRGVDVVVPAAGGEQVITLRLRPRDDTGGLAASAVEIPDHVAAGVTDEMSLDSYYRNDVFRTGSASAAISGGVRGGWDLLAGTSWTAGVTGRVFAGGKVQGYTAIRSYARRNSVITARGMGRWVAYDLPAVLDLSIAPVQGDPAPAATVRMGVPVRVRMRLPMELTRERGRRRPGIRLPVTDPGARTDLLASAALAAESVSTGDLYAGVRQAVAAELGPRGGDHPRGEARWAVDNLVNEPNLLRHLPDLGMGVHSSRFALAPDHAGDPTPVGDVPVLRRERASQLGQDLWLVRGTPFGVVRVTAEVTAVEILDRIPEDVVGSVAKRRQGMFDVSGASVSSDLGAGVHAGIGRVDDVSGTLGIDAFGSLGATAAAAGTLTSLVTPKVRLLRTGPTRRVRLYVRWTADLLRSDHHGEGVGESGASRRWPVTVDGQITARLADTDLARLLEKTGAAPEPVLRMIPDAPPRHDPDDAAPPPEPLLAGTGLGGGLVDEVSGTSGIVPRVETAARGAVRSVLRELGFGEDAVPAAFWLKAAQGWDVALSPAALKAHQGTLVQGGAQLPSVAQRLPRTVGDQVLGALPAELHLSGRVRAQIVPGTARSVAGSPAAVLEYGGDQWHISLAAERTARAVTGGGILSFNLSGLTGSAPVWAVPSLAAGGSVGFTRTVTMTSGTWIGNDARIVWTGPTNAFEVDVSYVVELQVRVALGGRLEDLLRTPVIPDWRGRLRVQVPAGPTGPRPDDLPPGVASLLALPSLLDTPSLRRRPSLHSQSSLRSRPSRPALESRPSLWIRRSLRSLQSLRSLHSLPSFGSALPLSPPESPLALPSPVPAPPHGWSPVGLSVLERVLELRAWPLPDVVASVLARAGAGQLGLTGQETASRLQVSLDPDALRIRLRPLIAVGGYTVVLRPPGGQDVLGVLRVAPELVIGPRGRRSAGWPGGLALGLTDESHLWLHNDSLTALGAPRMARVALGAGLGVEFPGAEVAQTWHLAGQQDTDRSVAYDLYSLDVAGEGVVWAKQAVDVESRGVRWTVRYQPTDAGAMWTRPVAETFLVEDGVSVVVPGTDHPLRRLAARTAGAGIGGFTASMPDLSIPETSVAGALRAPRPAPDDIVRDRAAAVMVGRGNAVFLGPAALGDARVAELGEPVLDQAVELLRGHGRRFLTPRAVHRALDASALPDRPPSAREYPELPPAVRDSLSLANLPGLLAQAMSGGVAVPIPPVGGAGRIRFGFFHLRASARGEARLVDRLAPGDARPYRYHLRDEMRYATLLASTTTTPMLTPHTLAVVLPAPPGAVSASRTSYLQAGDVTGMAQTFGNSYEVTSWAAVVAPHLVYETEVELELGLLRNVTSGQWATVLGAPVRAARWVAGQLAAPGRPGDSQGWRRPGDVPGMPSPVGRRTTSTTVRVAVPEPLVRHAPGPPRVTRLPPEAAAEVSRRALRPSAQALGEAGLVLYSMDASAADGVLRETTAGLAEAGGPLAAALSGGSHVARSLEYALSNVELSTRLNEFLAGDTYDLPLSSISGLLADTGTRVSIGATLVGATPLTWTTVGRTRSPATVRGGIEETSTGSTRSKVLGVSGGVTLAGGPALTASYHQFRTGEQTDRWVTLKEGIDTEAYSRTGPMLLVSADLVVSVVVGTRAESALTVRSRLVPDVRPGSVRVAVQADRAAVVAIDWAEARRLGIRHPDGEATESGWHLPPDRRPREAGSGDVAGEQLATAAQLLPAFREWRTLSGQATADGRMLLRGRPIDAAEVLDLLERHGSGSASEGLVLVASEGLAVGRSLADLSERPVVVTGGLVSLVPDGLGGFAVATDSVWQLMYPGGGQVPLAADLARALTTDNATGAIAMVRDRPDAAGSGTVVAGVAPRGLEAPVVWPAPAAPRRRVTIADLLEEPQESEPAGWWDRMLVPAEPAGDASGTLGRGWGVIKGTAQPPDEDEWRHDGAPCPVCVGTVLHRAHQTGTVAHRAR
jgi:hypothetical protein